MISRMKKEDELPNVPASNELEQLEKQIEELEKKKSRCLKSRPYRTNVRGLISKAVKALAVLALALSTAFCVPTSLRPSIRLHSWCCNQANSKA